MLALTEPHAHVDGDGDEPTGCDWLVESVPVTHSDDPTDALATQRELTRRHKDGV